tara:strand:- start:8656 stop:10437 length:1782 start_codon:yes stop_codon:yes gene_type:complete
MIKQKYRIYLLFIALVTLQVCGEADSSSPNDLKEKPDTELHDHSQSAEIYYCSMHPEIRQTEPGDCPICGMDLILDKNSASDSAHTTLGKSNSLQIGRYVSESMNLQTVGVESGLVNIEIQLPGKIELDPTKSVRMSTYIAGRIDQLFVNFEGAYVEKGQVVATLYSPQMITAQQEYLTLIENNPSRINLIESAQTKLQRLGFSEEDISNIEQTNTPTIHIELRAPAAGYIHGLRVLPEQYVTQGEALFSINDHRKVWLVLDAYEHQLPYLQVGQEIDWNLLNKVQPNHSGIPIKGLIEYIDPQLDPKLFTAKVRITLENANEELRPNQLLSGNLVVPYSLSEVLYIPKSAVLWTGERSFVYVVVETDTGSLYELRSIHVGPETVDGVIVHSGLNEGDVIVSAGTFVIDAASQLQGLASMAQHNLPYASTKKYTHSKISISNQNSSASIKNTFEVPQSAEIDSSLALYLSIKNSLIEGKFNATAKKIDQLSKLINSWVSDTTENSSILMFLSQTVQSLAGSTDIITSRINFVAFSQNYIDFIKEFNKDEELFVQFCPMANEGKGAYWLSQEEQIKNPYYGAMMLRCGEIIERI